MKLIDLSCPIDNDIRIHPLDSSASLKQEQSLQHDGFNSFRLEIGLHTGTHIDAPMHLTENKKYINEYDLNRFYGKGILIDVRDENIIRYKEKYNSTIQKDDIVIFYTGHSVKYNSDEYFTDHPVLDMEIAEFLVSKKIKMTGFDLPSPDRSPYLIHKKLLDNGIMIIENMMNLGKLIDKKFEIFAFPLNIKADSSIVRAAAKILDSPYI